MDLNGNNFKSLPDSFSEIIVGDHLNLSSNKLKSLPERFSEITLGENLYLRSNNLESLPDSFSEITLAAGNLYLSGNPHLTGVPENFPNVKGTVIR